MNWKDNYINEYEDSKGYWIVEDIESNNTLERETYSKRSRMGNMTINFNLTTYSVNIDHDNTKFIWYAIKDGIVEVERQISYKYYELYDDFNRTCDRKVNRLNYTDSLKQTLLHNDTFEDTQYFNATSTSGPTETNEFEYFYFKVQFVGPMFLVFQKYDTGNGYKIAWGQMFWKMLIFNDSDSNGIFNAAEFSGETKAQFDLQSGNEYAGHLVPVAAMIEQKYAKEDDPTTYAYPMDLDYNTFVESVQYDKPVFENDHLRWNVSYPEFPTVFSVTYGGEHYHPASMNYSDLDPTNYTYSFDYMVETNKSALKYELNMESFTNPYLMGNLTGMGLSIPSNTYILSDAEIQRDFNNVMSLPEDSFIFETDNKPVAEIDLSEDSERIYELEGFEGAGIISNHISRGSSVNFLCSEPMESTLDYFSEDFSQSIFAVESLVDADPTFTVVDRIYEIETINYPEWGGYALRHDPQLNTFYGENPTVDDDEDTPPDGEDSPPDDNGDGDDTPSDPFSIGIPNIVGMAGALFLGIIISINIGKKRIKNI